MPKMHHVMTQRRYGILGVLVGLFSLLLVACSSDSGSTPPAVQTFQALFATPTPPPISAFALREPLVVTAAAIPPLLGEPEPMGKVKVTFHRYEFATEITDRFTGRDNIKSRGQFLIVYYSIANDLNSRIQPSTQVNDRFYVVDERGRRWERADYTGGYGGLSASAAVAKGYDQPETWVAPGFENTTAIVFEVPTDVNRLTLVWERAGLKIVLN